MQIFFISTTFYSIELLVPSRLHNSFSQFGVDKIWIGPDQIGSDRIGLFISVCELYFSIWFSVFVKNSNGFSKFFPVCLRSERQLSASLISNSRKTQMLLRGMRDKQNVTKITSR